MAQRVPVFPSSGIAIHHFQMNEGPRPPQLQGDNEEVDLSYVSSLSEEELKDPGREVLVMTVDLGKGLKDRLVVRERDRPKDLAESFCRKHGLNERLCQALATNIEANLNQMHSSDSASLHGSDDMDSFQGTQTQPVARPFAYRHYLDHGRNVGDRLYRQGIQQRNGKRVAALRAKQAQGEEVLRELTFTPTISKRAEGQIVRSEETQWLQTQATKRQIEAKRREIMTREAEECTFTPQICPRSQELEDKRSREWQDRCEALYQQAAVRRARAEQQQEEHFNSLCPFHPEVEAYYEEGESISAHLQRLYSTKKTSQGAIDL